MGKMKPRNIYFILLLLPRLLLANEDRNSGDLIKEYLLNPTTVYNIPIGNTPTTIAFPGPLLSIDGANISAEPESNAPVLINYVAGRYFFSVRAGQPNAQAALNAVYRNQTYAFNFYHREDSLPYRTVRLIEKKGDDPFSSSSTLGTQSIRKTTPKALIALLDRAKSYHLVSQAYPGEMDDVEWLSHTSLVTEYRDFDVKVSEIFRFKKHDTIVFRIQLLNKIEEDIFYQPQSVAVRVAQNLYYPSIADASGIIPALSESAAYIAITGKPNGDRADLSIKNAFTIIVSKIQDPSKIVIP